MNTFWQDIKAILGKPTVKLVIFVFLSLAICGIYATESSNGPIHVIQNAFRTATMPLQQLSISAKSGMSTLSDKIFGDMASDDSYNDLKEENAKLKTQLLAAQKYKDEAQRLQGLLNLKDQYQTEGIGARVIGVSGNAWQQTITIGAGSEDGVSAGQTVLGKNGVLGQVDSVSLYTAQVRLLTDPDSGVAVKIKGCDSDCILNGSLDGVLYIDGLDLEANVNVGDVVVTSGLGGSYIEGLVVGSVSKIISQESGVNRRIVVSPIEKYSSITEVFVVRETL